MNTTESPAPSHREQRAWKLIFGAWLVAGGATLGALFLSEVMQVAPCVLCWYQRIFMFSMAVILPIGLFPLDRHVVRYALPLAALGWLFAFFHQLLLFGVIPEQLKPCTKGVPCTEQSFTWFGFVTLPTLSLLAFSIVIALLIATHSRGSK